MVMNRAALFYFLFPFFDSSHTALLRFGLILDPPNENTTQKKE